MPQSIQSVVKTQKNLNELVFVDANLPDYQTLLQGIRPTARVHIIPPAVDGIRFMAKAMAEEGKVDAIHILSHGVPGETKLGTAVLNRQTLSVYGQALHTIGQTLGRMGELLLYACNLGLGQAGRQLLTDLATITGATIAASENITGVGGDWELEARTGPIATPIVVSETAQASWQYAMAGEFADMRTWDVEGVPGGNWVDPNNPSQAFTLAASGRSVLQTVNNTSGTMFLLSDETNVINTTVTGTLQVKQGEADDDWIGFVLGYQNTDGDAFPEEYVGFTWSKGGTSPYSLSGIAGDNSGNVGVQGGQFLVYVDGEPADGDPLQADVFDSNAGTANRWQPGTQYTFSITYTSAFIKVTVDGALVLEASAADAGLTEFKAGQLGFSNASQAMVTFGNIRLFDASTEDSVAIANNDNYGIDLATGPNSLIVDRFSGLLANDADPDGDPFSLVIESDGTSLSSDYTFSSLTENITFTTTAGGSYTVFGDGSFNYTGPSSPADGLQDAFSYYLQDADGLSSAATAMVTIFQDNTDPTSILIEDVDAGDRPNIIVEEGAAVDTDIATVTVVDGDANDQHDLELVDASGGAFKIVNGVLKVRDTTALNSQTTHTITIKATDLVDQSITVSSITIQVDPNALPTSANSSASTRVNSVLDFGTGDFAFSDVDGDSFTSLKINQTPTFGTLFLDANDNDIVDSGETIQTNINDIIAKADLDAGRLKYISATDGSTSFLFSVNDGAAFQASPNTMSLTVNTNSAPTGSVTIGGTPTQGETLTASNTLADADGLGAITYTWFANGTSTGVTGSTYTLDQDDVGKVITVQASYTDNGGATESVLSSGTSTVTNVNDEPTGMVTITGTATQGETLTASNDLADADGLGAITYTWFANGTSTGVTGSTYTLDQDDVGKVITVQASYTDNGGATESVLSSGTSAVANVNDTTTGSVIITGTPTQGETLTASNTLADLDGLGPINYRWQESTDGTNWVNISGATADTFVLTQDQVNKFVRVKASFTDGGGTVETRDSAGTTAVANVNDPVTGTVTISGTATQGETLTASNTLADADGLGTITYTWFADGTSTGITGSTYTLDQDDVGKVITVQASYTDNGGATESVLSSGTSAVTNVNDPATGTVTITGTPTQGEILTASNDLTDADGLGPISYQWQESTDGTTWTNISGATDTTFTLGQGQVGKFVRAQASYTDGGNTLETVNSLGTASAIANVNDAPTGGMTLTGTLAQGSTLTADTSALVDDDGLGAFSYQWQQSLDGVTWTTIDGAASSTFTLTQAQVGRVVRAQVSYTDGGGTTESVTSAATASPIANVNDAPTGTVAIDGAVKQGAILTANTSTVVDEDGLGSLSYQWQQSVDGITWADIDGATNDSFSPRNGQVGKFLRVSVSYTDGQGTAESLTSAATTGPVEKFDATSDFNGDGSVDLFWQHRDAGQLAFWFMDNVNLEGGVTYDVADALWRVEAVGDLNGDKRPDLVFQHAITNDTYAWIMDGTEILADRLLPEVELDWDIVETGDFNNDGQDEILWRHAISGQLAVWYMESDGLTIKSGNLLDTPEFTDMDWDVVAVADFTKNGHMDIIWRNQLSGENAYWNMEGETFKGGDLMAPYTDTSWTIQGAADLNQDGNMDLLWENIEAGQNSVWFMNGLTFTGGTTLNPVEVDWVSIV